MLSTQESQVQLFTPVRQLNKIKTLLILTQTLDEYKAGVVPTNNFSKELVLSKIIAFCKVRTLFPEWYKHIAFSFEKSMKEDRNPQDWLANQLQKFGIYKASEDFQGKHIPDHYCMSFMFDLLYGTQRSDLCKPKSDSSDPYDFDRKMKQYLNETKSQPLLKQENLTRGDLIVYSIDYSNQSIFMHILMI